jgi:hypothetical protein
MTLPGFTAEQVFGSPPLGMQGSLMTSAKMSSSDAVVEPAGPVAYALCLALTCWLGPECFVWCIPAFVEPSP